MLCCRSVPQRFPIVVRGGLLRSYSKHVKSSYPLRPRVGQNSSDGSHKNEHPTKFKWSVGTAAIAVVGGTLYLTNDTFHDGAKHTALTLKRIGVVAAAATKCFYLYGKVLRLSSFDTEEERQKALSMTHLKAAAITLKALESNGGIYIKLGQHVSAMTYLLPKEWTETMIPLQQRCPESSLEEIERMFLEDLGVTINELFVEFDPKPVGVASLAQVHIGTLRDGHEKVAVKCQHPSLKEFIPIDIVMTRNIFDLMLKVFPEYPMTWLGDELQSSIYVELNFVNEAKNAQKTAQHFAEYQGKTALRIPKIMSANPRILIMEYVPGERLDNLEYLDRNHISRGEVSSCLSHIFNNMIFTPNVGVHCDPHGGNLAIRACEKNSDNRHNFEIILYDHGLYRQIPEQMRKDYARFWLALLDKDVEAMEESAKKFAGITHEQFPILAAAITGRDFNHALGGDITSQRDTEEIANMHDALVNKGQILDLMSLLSSLPRVILLILKTNDLTRHLDENLQNPLGMERTFFILATYCANAVLLDDIDQNNNQRKGISWLFGAIKSYWKYYKRVDELFWYDRAMICKRFIHKFI